MEKLIREHHGNYCQTCTVKDSVKIGLCLRCISESSSYSLQEKKRSPEIDYLIDTDVSWNSITNLMYDVILHKIPLSIALVRECKRNYGNIGNGIMKKMLLALSGEKIQECDICKDRETFLLSSCMSCESKLA